MRRITITLNRSVLLHHIGQIAYKEGAVINTGDDKARSDVQDVASDDDTVARLTYSLDTAWGELLAALSRMTERSTDVTSSDDSFTERQTYVFTLAKGDEFPDAIIEPLTRAMHDFMVFSALAQWFAITKPEKVAYYDSMAADRKDAARDYANRDDGPLRIPPWPPLAY